MCRHGHDLAVHGYYKRDARKRRPYIACRQCDRDREARRPKRRHRGWWQ